MYRGFIVLTALLAVCACVLCQVLVSHGTPAEYYGVELLTKTEQAQLLRDLADATQDMDKSSSGKGVKGVHAQGQADASPIVQHHSAQWKARHAKAVAEAHRLEAQLEKDLQPVAKAMRAQDRSGVDFEKPTVSAKDAVATANKDLIHHLAAAAHVKKQKTAAASAAAAKVAAAKKSGSGDHYDANAMVEAMRLDSDLLGHDHSSLKSHTSTSTSTSSSSNDGFVDARKLAAQLAAAADDWDGNKKKNKAASTTTTSTTPIKTVNSNNIKQAAQKRLAHKHAPLPHNLKKIEADAFVDPRVLANKLAAAADDWDKPLKKGSVVKYALGTTDLDSNKVSTAQANSESLENDLAAAADTISHLRLPVIRSHMRSLGALHAKAMPQPQKKKAKAYIPSRHDLLSMKQLDLPTNINDIMEPPVLQRMRAKNNGHLRLPSFHGERRVVPHLPSFSVKKMEQRSSVPTFSVSKMEKELSQAKDRALRLVPGRSSPKQQMVQRPAMSNIDNKNDALASQISSSVLAGLKNIVTKEVERDLNMRNKA